MAINGPAIKTFAQLYKENRLENVSSFITADSIIHPFLSFQNTIRLAVIEKSIAPMLESLLVSMIESCGQEYMVAEDAETKDEIKFNLVFLLVAVRILQPDYVIPDYPGVKQLVETELSSIKQKRPAYSVIFHHQENFALLDPIGWHKATPEVQRFFCCYQWLGRMGLELNDNEGSNGNEFRRAFLLFQSLMKAKINSVNNGDRQDTGYTTWQKINETLGAINLNEVDEDIATIPFQRVLPSNFAGIFPSAKSVSRISLSSLSDPLTRTRLFLTLRSNAPRQQLNNTSIFSLNKTKMGTEKQLKFCLMNPVYQGSTEACFQMPVFQKDAAEGFSLTPIALELAESKGITWAKRILSDNVAKLNDRVVGSANNNKIVSGAFWDTFKTLSIAYRDPSPETIQTKQWRTFCVERQAAAWVDNMLSSGVSDLGLSNQDGSDKKNDANTAANNGTMSATIRKFGIPSWRTVNSFNYLEPSALLYEKMAESETNFEHALSQANLFPAEYIERSHDFVRLLKRLASISNLELNNQTMGAEDQSLLAGIDKVLHKIEPPLLGNLYIPFAENAEIDLAGSVIGEGNAQDLEEKPLPSPKKIDQSAVITLSENTSNTMPAKFRQLAEPTENKGAKLAGVNMGLGYPACIFIILQYKHVYYLLRGAAYSYHEQCGSPINSKHWERQLELGFFMDPPFWCGSFQRVAQ